MTEHSVPLMAAVVLAPLWLLAALFFTALGRNDSRPAPEGFWRTYAGWLWIQLLPVVMLWAYFATPLRQIGFLPVLIATMVINGLLVGYGEKLPLVGPWIAALRRREARRRDHGIL